MFDRLAETVIKHPKAIVLIWAAILLLASPFMAKVLLDPSGVLSYDMTSSSSEGSESVRGLEILADTEYFYSDGSGMDTVLVVECADSAEYDGITLFGNDLEDALQRHYGQEGGEEKVALVSAGFFSKSGGYPGIVIFAISFSDSVKPSGEVEVLRGIVSETQSEGGYTLSTYLTGQSAISHDTEAGAMEDVKRIDPFSILLVLLLIGLFFRSVISATTPPLTIGVAYGVVLAAIYGLSHFMEIYYITSTIVLVSMLGAGCDYCIFIIARYREERKTGKTHEDSLRESVRWAGESITISGIAVVIGFGVMAFCSFSVISAMGIVLAAGIVFALIAALTLIPSIISILGERMFWPSRLSTYSEGSKTMKGWYGKMSRAGARYFANSARFSMKHAGAIVAAVVLITIPLGYVAATHTTSYDMIATMPSGEAKDGVNQIVEHADGGMLMPTYVLLEVDGEIAEIREDAITIPDEGSLGVLTWTSSEVYDPYVLASNTLAAKMMDDAEEAGNHNISGVWTIAGWEMLVKTAGSTEEALELLPESVRDYVREIVDIDDLAWMYLTGGKYTKANAIDYIVNYAYGSISKYHDGHQYIKLTVLMSDEPMSQTSMGTVTLVKASVNDYMATATAFSASYVTGQVVAMYDVSQVLNTEFVYIEGGVAVLIFLLLFFVMGSYLTPLRAVLTILTSVVWTLGMTYVVFGMWLGMEITWIMPIILFVICLGLGMDYDILLTTRIRENVMKGMSNDDAIEHAVERSGAVITICGLIMSGAFGTMMLSTSPMLMEFGFALSFAILVDALFMRTYVVPAVMHLLGRYNWSGPARLRTRTFENNDRA